LKCSRGNYLKDLLDGMSLERFSVARNAGKGHCLFYSALDVFGGKESVDKLISLRLDLQVESQKPEVRAQIEAHTAYPFDILQKRLNVFAERVPENLFPEDP